MVEKVSIIIPYSIDRGWLKEAVDSVYTQTYQGEIEIIHSKSDNGVSYNINRGIEKSTGSLIKYLCEDDWLTPNSIEDSVKAIQGFDFIHGNANNVRQGKAQIQKPIIKAPTLETMLDRNTIHGGTLMYKREVFDKVGLFNENIDCAEEYEFNLRCLSKGLKIGYCDALVYNYRRHNLQKSLGNTSKEYQAIRQQKIEAIQQMYA